MVPEICPVDLELAVVVHVQEFMAQRVLSKSPSPSSVRRALNQSSKMETHAHVLFVDESVLAEQDSVLRAESSCLGRVARGAVDAFARRLAA